MSKLTNDWDNWMERYLIFIGLKNRGWKRVFYFVYLINAIFCYRYIEWLFDFHLIIDIPLAYALDLLSIALIVKPVTWIIEGFKIGEEKYQSKTSKTGEILKDLEKLDKLEED